MPRVGFSIEEGVSSSQFKFEEGRGRIVAAIATVEKIQDFDAKCGIKVSIQRIGRDGKPTDDEPVEEFLPCGPITKFHPANASSPDDADPEDLGDEVGVEGNCILAVEGAHIDRKAKLWIFGSSAQEKGLRDITGFIDANNHRMLCVVEELGFVPVSTDECVTTVRLDLS